MRKILPNQVPDNWNLIKTCIIIGSRPSAHVNEGSFGNIMSALMKGDADVWAVIKENDKGYLPIGAVISYFTFDRLSNAKSLFIYCAASIETIPTSAVAQVYEVLKDFALDNGCSSITGVTDNKQYIRFIKSLGGSADFRHVSIPLEN